MKRKPLEISLPSIRSVGLIEDLEDGRQVTGVREDASVSVTIRNYDGSDKIDVRVTGAAPGYYQGLILIERLMPLIMEYRHWAAKDAVKELSREQP